MVDFTKPTPTVLPFGKHKGQPLADVPGDYLAWLTRTCKLSSGLRSAVAQELARRGLRVPPAPSPRPIRPCDRCGPGAGVIVHWQELRSGTKRLRVDCRRCGAFLTYPPMVSPYTTMADANKSETAVLDVLMRLDDLGVRLRSDGKAVWLDQADRQVPPDLRALVRSCSHELARLLGRQ
jgi:uncharacterized protein (DUF3820 family)